VNRVPADRIIKLAAQYRLNFRMTGEEEQQLIGLGATKDLITGLKPFARPSEDAPDTSNRAEARPSLIVNSTTPRAEVYMNDIRMGRAGEDGVLKIPDVPTGKQRIRVSLEGFADFISQIETAPGFVATLAVPALEKSTESLESLSVGKRPDVAALAGLKTVVSSDPGDPLIVRDAFHVIGVPFLRRNNKCHLSVTTKYIFFSTDDKRLYKIPVDRIQRVQMISADRYYAKTTYALVVAFGAPGALMLAKKRKVDALAIDYTNERGGAMKLVVQVPQGMGTPCLERLAFGGIAIGPAHT
jgi:hypothetical protein